MRGAAVDQMLPGKPELTAPTPQDRVSSHGIAGGGHRAAGEPVHIGRYYISRRGIRQVAHHHGFHRKETSFLSGAALLAAQIVIEEWWQSSNGRIGLFKERYSRRVWNE
jgi:hypothetical protein